MTALASPRVMRRGAARALWTAPHVGQVTISAFRVVPHWPVFSIRRGHFETAGEGDRLRPGPEKVFSWGERFITSRQRIVLFHWASCKAKTPTAPDTSLRGWAEEFFNLQADAAWVKFERTRDGACAGIAERLNEREVPIFYL